MLTLPAYIRVERRGMTALTGGVERALAEGWCEFEAKCIVRKPRDNVVKLAKILGILVFEVDLSAGFRPWVSRESGGRLSDTPSIE